MGNGDVTGGGAGALLGRARVEMPAKGKLQVDIGNYEILVGDVVVGEVWVEVDPHYPEDRKRTVEHWCLFSNYVPPSDQQRRVDLSFRHVAGRRASLQDFREFARKTEGARYIVAQCLEQAP